MQRGRIWIKDDQVQPGDLLDYHFIGNNCWYRCQTIFDLMSMCNAMSHFSVEVGGRQARRLTERLCRFERRLRAYAGKHGFHAVARLKWTESRGIWLEYWLCGAGKCYDLILEPYYALQEKDGGRTVRMLGWRVDQIWKRLLSDLCGGGRETDHVA